MWRVSYPVLLHFAVSQIVSGGALLWLNNYADLGAESYYQYTIVLTGITALLSLIPALYFYRRDHFSRVYGGVLSQKAGNRLSAGEIVLLFLMGGGLSIYGNLLVNMLGSFLEKKEYQELMNQVTEGKSLVMMIFWMGIVAPVAEEVIFRWLIYLRLRDYCRTVSAAAVISALIFGLYHGNLLQAVYAFLLGMLFAMILEKTGSLVSCLLLHMGANTASLITSEFASAPDLESVMPFLSGYLLLLMVSAVGGCWYFFGKRQKSGMRMV